MNVFEQRRKTLAEFITSAYDVRSSTAKQIVSIVEQIIELENHEYEEGVKDGRAEMEWEAIGHE